MLEKGDKRITPFAKQNPHYLCRRGSVRYARLCLPHSARRSFAAWIDTRSKKKKNRPLLILGKKRREREGGKKRVAHPKLDCVRTRDGGLDVKGWRESAVSLAEFDENGFGYVSACCYDSFLCCFEGEKNFRRPFSPAGNPPRIIN